MRLLLVTAALLVMLPGIGETAVILINNGLAPPDPNNVIDYDIPPPDVVYVRNVGCGVPEPSGPCSSPGNATTVEMADYGSVDSMSAFDSSAILMTGGTMISMIARNNSSVTVDAEYGFLLVLHGYDSSTVTVNDVHEIEDDLAVFDSATLTMNGGSVFTQLVAYDSSTVTINRGLIGYLGSGDFSAVTVNGGRIFGLSSFASSTINLSRGSIEANAYVRHASTMVLNGGTVQGNLSAEDSGTVTMNGGTVDGELRALESGVIEIVGLNFEVDGVPVSYGDLVAMTGTLTGTLALGDPIDNVFRQGGGDYTGTIRLVHPAVVPLFRGLWVVVFAGILGAAMLLGARRRLLGHGA